MTLVLFFSPSDNVPIKGNFSAGHKEIMLSDKVGDSPLKMSVFYPVEKKKGWNYGGDKTEKPNWCPDGPHTVNGMFVNGRFSK
jgi:hypothetical protein